MARLPFPLQVVLVAGCAFGIMWFSTPSPHAEYDYTRRVAVWLLDGSTGTEVQPPPWLNEMVPHDGRYFSVFPLGSVLSAMPLAIPTRNHDNFWFGVPEQKATQFLLLRGFLSLIAAGIAAFAYALAGRHGLPAWKKILFAFTPLFATCLWPNLSYGGAWQMALGFAVLGTLGAIYFSTGTPRPFLAGAFFALGFGNRTEILLTAPILYFLLLGQRPPDWLRRIVLFSIVPFLLGVATLAYNAARFGTPFDFGYARIPGVLEEPWYRDGIFALSAIPRNAYAMLIEPWRQLPEFPWLVPTGWGGSLFLYSPFLLLVLFRIRRGNPTMRVACWTAVAMLTFLLWIHGNPGGWQVSYRYASVLFPWLLVLLLEGEPRKKIGWAPALIAVSIAINGFANWIFCHTPYMRP